MWRKISLFILFLATTLLWIDVFTYQGYLESQVHLPSKLILLGVFVLGILAVYLNKSKVKVSPTALIIPVIILALYCVIIAIEGSTAQGYVFAHLGLRPESMFVAVLATLWLLATFFSKTFWNYLFIVVISFYFVRLIPIVITQSSVTLREVVRAPFASYDQKMTLTWGDFYTHMQEIQDTTNEDSVVTIPSDVKKYPLDGNAFLVRYFVYPRTVVVEDTP